MNTPVCNLNCICIDADCTYTHLPILKDRKIIKNLYDKNSSNISKFEENADKRKANCRFGQLCYNEKCGFRHRISIKDRLSLIKSFNDYKLNDIKVEKKIEVVKIKEFDISHKNSFETLEENEEVPIETTKLWADICK